MLPVADHLGCVSGTDPDKMKIGVDIGKGSVLDIPVLERSPVIFELEVTDFIQKHDGRTLGAWGEPRKSLSRGSTKR